MEGERRKRRRKRSAPKKKREAEGMERGERGDRKSVLRGQSSPGSLQSGQDPSKGILQIPHVSVGSSVHDQDATVCQFFTLTFIIDDECLLHCNRSVAAQTRWGWLVGWHPASHILNRTSVVCLWM